MDCADTTRVTALRSNPPHAGGAAIAPASPALQADVVPALDIVLNAYWVRVSIAKPAKFDDVKAVGVTIERRRPAVAKG